jgi:hypothetical protein
MPILMIMQWSGVTPQQYDQVRELVNWEGNAPAGGLYHAAAFDAQGLRVVDVWDTAEQFQTFVETRLMPGVKQLGIQGEPAVEVLPIHRLFTPGYTAK